MKKHSAINVKFTRRDYFILRIKTPKTEENVSLNDKIN